MNLTSPSGLRAFFGSNGNLSSLEAGDIRISLTNASLHAEPSSALFLRINRGNGPVFPLTGRSDSEILNLGPLGLGFSGFKHGIRYSCVFRFSEKESAWMWEVTLKNESESALTTELFYVQDVGLKPVNAGLINQYYVAQYLERLIFDDPDLGSVIMCRQNMREPTGNPWILVACLDGAASGCTDGQQFYGSGYRETGHPNGLMQPFLGGNLAGESPIIGLQSKSWILSPGTIRTIRFAGLYRADHPLASSLEDLCLLKTIETAFGESGLLKGEKIGRNSSGSMFRGVPLFPAEDLGEEEIENLFPGERRFQEMADGRPGSFFYNDYDHVVLKAKESNTYRPHGHIMQAATGFLPDDRIMSTTAYASGIFNSHVSQGNTNFNVLLSIVTSPFNLSPEKGQRILVRISGKQYLLGIPSVFVMGLNYCRWIYKSGTTVLEVRTHTSMSDPRISLDFMVLSGPLAQVTVTHDFDPLNRWRVSPDRHSGLFSFVPDPDSMLAQRFPDARFRLGYTESRGVEAGFSEDQNLFIISYPEVSQCTVSIFGEVPSRQIITLPVDTTQVWDKDLIEGKEYWKRLSGSLEISGKDPHSKALQEILPWFGINAMTHFLTPYGLEQFSGAAWGTRDVSQGPVDLLLTAGKQEEVRALLLKIFSNQHPDGGWAQWWMFDRYPEIRAHEAHGDIFYWVILALCRYIRMSGDAGILREEIPYYNPDQRSFLDPHPVKEHVDRLIRMIMDSFISGTSLVPFGGGDWNDSLQPVSRDLASRMISSWTVEMNYQAFKEYAEICQMTQDREMAEKLIQTTRQIREDFNRWLMRDGIVAGYGKVSENGRIDLLLHPSDDYTGVSYSLLPMERGILSGMFTPEQATRHLDLIRRHLLAPDGARLMDRPLKYRGGVQTIFQRAESSTFFGREIGLMYVHEHIRYAESLAMMGKAVEFVHALRQAVPVACRDLIPNTGLRQSNCYYSSSDIHFSSRYEADEDYQSVVTGKREFSGGWRVYSSGPGIFISLIMGRLLGFRPERERIILDPVIPVEMDGLSARFEWMGRQWSLTYRLKTGCHTPSKIFAGGIPVDFVTEENPYRSGGAVIRMDQLPAISGSSSRIDLVIEV